MLGRAFMYGVGAFGKTGGDHAFEILKADLEVNMVNLGCASVDEIPAPVHPDSA